MSNFEQSSISNYQVLGGSLKLFSFLIREEKNSKKKKKSYGYLDLTRIEPSSSYSLYFLLSFIIFSQLQAANTPLLPTSAARFPPSWRLPPVNCM